MKPSAVALILALPLLIACGKKEDAAANLNDANKVAMRGVRLFYESNSLLLAAEPRNVPLPGNEAAAIPIVVRELMKGPAMKTTTRLFPEDIVVRGAWLLPGGTAIVDLGGPTLTNGWGTGSHHEIMAAYSLVETLTANFPQVKRVRILINGTPAETLAGHISLDRSLTPKGALVQR